MTHIRTIIEDGRKDIRESGPYIIAEAGVNHEGSMELAKRLIEEAKEGNAQAIKFQSYKAKTLASKNSPSYWDLSKEPTTSQFELFQKHDSFWKKEFVELKAHCDKFDIEFMSTPFDIESADFLDDLMPVYKISSSDLNNHPFISYMCEKGKPILLSTGASYLWEVMETVELIEKYNLPYCLMHCILNYPTMNENAHLGYILDLAKQFPKIPIGYSDHTLPQDMSVITSSILLGAHIIEKHFTHDKTLPGNDHYHAMDKEDMKIFWDKWQQIEELIGSDKKSVLESEEISRKNARRSLVATKEIKMGDKFTEDNVTWKRPAFGISPKYYSDLLTRVAKVDIEEDTPLQWKMIK